MPSRDALEATGVIDHSLVSLGAGLPSLDAVLTVVSCLTDQPHKIVVDVLPMCFHVRRRVGNCTAVGNLTTCVCPPKSKKWSLSLFALRRLIPEY